MGTYREFFGLKDKDGKEYKLLYGNAIVGNLAIEEITSASEFKVGQWVYYTNPPNYKGMDAVFRITDIVETSDKGRYRVSNIDGGWYEADRCRPATKEEIESHLRRICDEKGLMNPGQAYKSATNKQEFVFNRYGHTEYVEKHDSFYNNGMDIYCNGKFAEIIPDKKKLPKTKQEFIEFAETWQKNMPWKFFVEFLDEYED